MKCKYCSKKFSPIHWNNLYCGKECAKKGYFKWKKRWDTLYQRNERVKQKHRENQRKYYQSNPERIKQIKIKYLSSEKGKKKIREYNHSSSRKENSKRYEQSPEGKLIKRRYLDSFKGRETKHKYYQTEVYIKNRRHNLRRYRTKKKELIFAFTKLEWEEKLNKTKGICPICKKYVGINNLELDHVIPISKAKKGFIYTINNVQPLCSKCNRIKSDKD